MTTDMQETADVVAETESFAVWRTKDDDEVSYHLELGMVTVHLDEEEWQELVQLIHNV